MKKTLLTSLAAVFAVSAASAMELTPYAAVRGGFDRAIMNTAKADGESFGNPAGNGFMLGVAGGVSFNASEYFDVRGEIEYTYADRDIEREYSFDEDDEMVKTKDKWDTSAHTVMLNAFADIKTGTAFTPYIGAGLGWSWNNAEIKADNGTKLDFDDNAFAWQVGAGVSYAATDALRIDLGYRFMDVMGLKASKTLVEEDGEAYKVTLKNDTYSHQIYLGARYAF